MPNLGKKTSRKRQAGILLVDDDASGRAILGLALRRAGHSVESAPDGAQALERIARGCFDWMITDADMHPMSGVELIARAKRMCPDLRIILISALFSEYDAKAYPVEKFLAKPVELERLLEILGGPVR